MQFFMASLGFSLLQFTMMALLWNFIPTAAEPTNHPSRSSLSGPQRILISRLVA